MRGYRKTNRRRTTASGKSVRGYTLRGKNGRINYVGITESPSRRAGEHKRKGKSGTMKVETRPMSKKSARRWESGRLTTYRRNHGGKNPRHNKTRQG